MIPPNPADELNQIVATAIKEQGIDITSIEGMKEHARIWNELNSRRPDIDLPKEFTGERVYIRTEGDGTHSLVAENDCGFNSTSVPLEKLIAWLKVNMPELL